MPVVARHGVRGPGQNRDKFRTAELPLRWGLAAGCLMLGAVIAAGPRSYAEVAAERDAQRAAVEEEIRNLAAEFHAQLPREQANAIGAAYARYSSRHQESIADQIRGILQEAVRHSIFIPAEFIIFDQATRGVKNSRPGLNALRDVLDQRSVQAVLFFATNRLFRKAYRSLQFVEEQLVERGIRGIFIRSGVDTADKARWSQMLMMNAQLDEFTAKSNVEHIRAAHEGLLEKRYVHGTLPLGYRGEPVPNEQTRKGKPRHRIVIDPVTKPAVESMFRWYADDGLTLAEIARRLNDDPLAPCPPKSPHRHWTPGNVRQLLSNPRYCGHWCYGATENRWISSKDYSRPVRREKPIRELYFEDLRIIGDDMWHRVQNRLATQVDRQRGRKPRNPVVCPLSRLLGGLFYCPVHQHALYIGGTWGRYLFCPRCRDVNAKHRPLFSLLHAGLALEKTCQVIAEAIHRDHNLVNKVATVCRRSVEQLQSPDPNWLEGRTARIDRLNRQIEFILRNAGETSTEEAESERQLRQLRRERLDLQREIESLKQQAAGPMSVPDEDEIQRMIEQFSKEMPDPAACDSEGAGMLREILDLVTGGSIELVQCGERRHGQGWLQGRFPMRLVEAIAKRCLQRVGIECDPEIVTIDYRAEPSPDPALIHKVLDRYDAGALYAEIKRELRIGDQHFYELLKAGLAARGESLPEAHQRRVSLQARRQPPLYAKFADPVSRMVLQSLTLQEIADRLKTSKRTVLRAWQYSQRASSPSPPDRPSD